MDPYWNSLSLMMTSLLLALLPAAKAMANLPVQSHDLKPAAGLTAQGTPAQAERLFQQGMQQEKQGQWSEALATYQQVLVLRQAKADQVGEAAVLNAIAKVYNSLWQPADALDAALRAQAIYQAIDDPVGTVSALAQVADAYVDLDLNAEALETLQQALRLQRSVPDAERGALDEAEAKVLQNLGRVHRSLEQYPEAIQFFERSRERYQDLGQSFEVGVTTANLGTVYLLQGDRDRAVQFFQNSLTTLEPVLADSQRSGNRAVEASTLYLMGNTYTLLAEPQSAIAAFERSHTLFRDLGYGVRAAETLLGIGYVYTLTNQYADQITVYQQALAMFQERGDLARVADLQLEIGKTHILMGQYGPAIASCQQALALYRDLDQASRPDRAAIQTRMGEALAKIGEAYAGLGQYPTAIATFQEALSLYQLHSQEPSVTFSDRSAVAELLQSLATAHNRLDQYPQALDALQQALAIVQELGDRRVEAQVLSSLAAVYVNLGQFEQAETLSQQAAAAQQAAFQQQEALTGPSAIEPLLDLDFTGEELLLLARQMGNRALEASALEQIGSEYAEAGQNEAAMEAYQQALVLAREIGDRSGEGATLISLAFLYSDLQQPVQTLETLQQALAIQRELGNRSVEARVLSLIGGLYNQGGQYTEAEAVLSDAVAIWESLRPGLSDENKISQFETIFSTYNALQRSLVAQEKHETALEVAEQGRARAFAELLASRLSDRPDEFRNTKPLTLSQIRQVAQAQDATLVEYSTVEDALYIWVIQPSGEVAFRSVEAQAPASTDSPASPSTGLAAQVSATRAALGAGSNRAGAVVVQAGSVTRARHLKELHQWLIDPITDLLPTDPERRVIFIPQRELFLVPFAALQDDSGTPLIQQHTILTAPSIQVLRLTQEIRESLGATREGRGIASPDDLLVVGNPTMPTLSASAEEPPQALPPLPEAEREAIAIATFLGTEAVTGSQATEPRVTQRMSNARIIHLATHGLLEYGLSPESMGQEIPGAIALAPDPTTASPDTGETAGRGESRDSITPAPETRPSDSSDGLLTSAEILDMNLQAELVVLSACDTGRGDITGDGVIGLSRALVTAGVPSVIVSLWSVPDAPTADLMTEFYHQLQQHPDKARALRQAMLITMQTHPNPTDWAAFTIIGQAE